MSGKVNYNLYADDNIPDVEDVLDKVREIWVKVYPECVFTEASPATEGESLDLPHVVYSLVHRRHSDDFNGSNKPRQLETYPDPEQPGHNLTRVSEWFDCLTQFEIYGNTKVEAREWKKKLELFMLRYSGELKRQGAQDVVFVEELANEVSTVYRQELPRRVLRYMVRIQRTQIVRNIRLTDVEVEMRTKTPDGQPERFPTKPESEFFSYYEKTK